MTVNKIKLLAATTILLGAASAAQAGFVTSDAAAPVKSTIDIVNENQFKGKFASLGIFQYTLGASLNLDAAGTVTYYYYGKEAGFQNIFTAGTLTPSPISYNSGFTPNVQDYFAAPKLIGSLEVGAGVLDFKFCAWSSPTASEGCKTNAQNDALNQYISTQSIAYSLFGNTAWLFWDDSGAGPDDNHDDMLIKAVFTPKAVPEPATLGLLGLGLLGTWVGSRRRLRKA